MRREITRNMKEIRENISLEVRESVIKIILKDIDDNFYFSDMKTTLRKYDGLFELAQGFENKFKKAIKKICKQKLKNEENQQLFKNCPHIINQGVKAYEHGESWLYWYLFNAENEEQVEDIINKYGGRYIYIEADEIHSPYDCTGQTFSREMCIRKVGENRFLATKSYAIDC